MLIGWWCIICIFQQSSQIQLRHYGGSFGLVVVNAQPPEGTPDLPTEEDVDVTDVVPPTSDAGNIGNGSDGSSNTDGDANDGNTDVGIGNSGTIFEVLAGMGTFRTFLNAIGSTSLEFNLVNIVSSGNSNGGPISKCYL